ASGEPAVPCVPIVPVPPAAPPVWAIAAGAAISAAARAKAVVVDRMLVSLLGLDPCHGVSARKNGGHAVMFSGRAQ
ncbi:hypothetical protein HMPREF0731_4761, partial [Pseudoroseomonas cervicalis ATCC 49957]